MNYSRPLTLYILVGLTISSIIAFAIYFPGNNNVVGRNIIPLRISSLLSKSNSISKTNSTRTFHQPHRYVEIIVKNIASITDKKTKVGFIVVINEMDFDWSYLEIANQTLEKYQNKMSIAVLFRVQVVTDQFETDCNMNPFIQSSKFKSISPIDLMCQIEDGEFDFIFSLKNVHNIVVDKFELWFQTFEKFAANDKKESKILLLPKLHNGTFRLPEPGSIRPSTWSEPVSMLNFIGAGRKRFDIICQQVRNCIGNLKREYYFELCLNRYLQTVENEDLTKIEISSFYKNTQNMLEINELIEIIEESRLRSKVANEIVENIESKYFSTLQKRLLANENKISNQV